MENNGRGLVWVATGDDSIVICGMNRNSKRKLAINNVYWYKQNNEMRADEWWSRVGLMDILMDLSVDECGKSFFFESEGLKRNYRDFDLNMGQKFKLKRRTKEFTWMLKLKQKIKLEI
jgi:hypothetical protein